MNQNQSLLSPLDDSSSTPFDHWSLFQSRLHWVFEKKGFTAVPDWKYLPHPVAAWKIVQGEVTLRFGGHTEVHGPDRWIFPPALEGYQAFSPDAHLISLRFHAEWFHGVPIFDRRRSQVLEGAQAGLASAADTLLECVQRLPPSSRLPGAPLTGSFSDFLTMTFRFHQWIFAYHDALVNAGVCFEALSHLSPPVAGALRMMKSHPLPLPLHEKELARQVGISLSQLNKYFARDLKMTPAFIWNRHKLAHAKELLRNGTESAKAITYQLGYTSPAHFSHWFRKQTGYSPMQYRRKSAEQRDIFQ